jgi:ATP-dependent RNA helicase DeaD
VNTFEALGIRKDLIKGLNELSIKIPSDIQQKTIPILLKNNTDFIGQAQTGTGKTAAFGLPLLQRIDIKNNAIQALVVCPTRELCLQISKQLFKFTKYAEEKIFTETVYGGEKIDKQITALRRTTHIVVATPGRLLDLIRRKDIDIRQVNTVVLDEADEMLSMGFRKDIDAILENTKGKAESNIWLFSATIPKGIKEIVDTFMSKDAKQIDVSTQTLVNSDIFHQYAVVENSLKTEALYYFLKSRPDERGIIFCRTKVQAQTVTKQVQTKKIPVDVIHGDLKQIERDKVMRAFKNENLRVLVATDISARGIDVADLAYVVHYQLPDQLDYYVHRAGRTGRAGKPGTSLALVAPSEVRKIKEISEKLNIRFKKVE